ncbi:protein phosphatase 2C family protein [Candidatus Gottesmanbacteria bacterium]|nr:protein phosphatase 2C family protein [Candidatus Gottesmanbacteria bacterium]
MGKIREEKIRINNSRIIFLTAALLIVMGFMAVFNFLKISRSSQSIISKSASEEVLWNPARNFENGLALAPVEMDLNEPSTSCNVDSQNGDLTCKQESGLPEDSPPAQVKTEEEFQNDLEDKIIFVYKPTNYNIPTQETTSELSPLQNESEPDTPTPIPIPSITMKYYLSNLPGDYPYVIIMDKNSPDISEDDYCRLSPKSFKCVEKEYCRTHEQDMQCKVTFANSEYCQQPLHKKEFRCISPMPKNIPLRRDINSGFSYIDPKDYKAYFDAICNPEVKNCQVFVTAEDLTAAVRNKYISPRIFATAATMLAVPTMVFGGEAAFPLVVGGAGTALTESLPYAYVYGTNMIPAAAWPVLEFAGAATTVAVAKECADNPNNDVACANLFAYGSNYLATGISGFENFPLYARSIKNSATVQNILADQTGALNLGYIYTMLTGRTLETESYLGRMLMRSPFFRPQIAPWYSRAVNAFLAKDYNTVLKVSLEHPNIKLKVMYSPGLYSQYGEKAAAVWIDTGEKTKEGAMIVESLVLNAHVENPNAVTAQEAFQVIINRMFAEGLLNGSVDYLAVARTGPTTASVTQYQGLRSNLIFNKYWAGSLQNMFLIDTQAQVSALMNATRIRYGEEEAAKIFGTVDMTKQWNLYRRLNLDSRQFDRLAIKPLTQQELKYEQNVPANFNRQTYTPPSYEQPEPQQPPKSSNPQQPRPNQPRKAVIGRGFVNTTPMESHGGYVQDRLVILYDAQGNAYFAIADGVSSGSKYSTNAARDASNDLTQKLKEAIETYGEDYEQVFSYMESATRSLDLSIKESYEKAATTVIVGTVTPKGKLILYTIGDTEARVVMSSKIAHIDAIYAEDNTTLIRGEYLAPDAFEVQLGSQYQAEYANKPNQIGSGQVRQGRFTVYTPNPGYRTIISSDGISKILSEEEIFNIVKNAKSPQEAESNLVNSAIERMKQIFTANRQNYEQQLADGKIDQQRFYELSQGLADDYSAIVIFH